MNCVEQEFVSYWSSLSSIPAQAVSE